MHYDHTESFPLRSEKEIERLIDELSRVVKDREDEFLDLGGAVQQHALASADLSTKATQMAEATSAETVDGIIEKLQAELNSMMELADIEESRRTIEHLDKVGNDVEELRANVGEFKGVIRRLQMLGISTRIESARLGSKGRGFSTLSDDVDRLAVNIETHSTNILEHSKTLGDLISSAGRESGSMCAHQEDTSRTVFAQLHDDMQRLSLMAHNSEAASTDITRLTKGITDNIGEIIASLQFHDMARQQIEHVEEALQEVVGVFREPEDDTEEHRLEITGWCGDVCTLQSSQMNYTSEHFVAAVERIRDSLHNTSDNVSEVATLALSLGTGVGDEKESSSPLDRTEESLNRIIECMGNYAEQGETIGELMASVAQTVDSMSEFLSDIEEVGEEIELIALNASIKAAHTGDEGKALGVLAQAIQGLSQAAQERTESVTAILRAIHESAETLKKSADNLMDTSQIAEVIDRLKGFVNELRERNQEFSTSSDIIGSSSQVLARELRRLADSLSFHHDVANGLNKIREDVDALAAEALEIAPPDGNQKRSERLNRMLARYTMETERLIHEGDGVAVTHEAAVAGADVELFGDEDDNVELFGDDDDGVELFDAPAGEDDLGDNVELF